MVSLLDYFNIGTMPYGGSETDIVATDVYGRPIRRGPDLTLVRGAPYRYDTGGIKTGTLPPIESTGDTTPIRRLSPGAAPSQPDLIDALVSIARRRAAAQPAPEVNTARDALAKGLNAGAAAGTAFAKNKEPSFIERLLGISSANAATLNLTPEQRRNLFPSTEERARDASMALEDDPSMFKFPTPYVPLEGPPTPPAQAPTSSADDSGPGFFASIGEILRSPEVQYLLDVMASPAFQDPRGLSAGIVGGAADVRAQRAAAAEKQAELETARRIEERRLRAEERDIERLDIERARQALAERKAETPKTERATGPVIEAFAAIAETDEDIRKIIDGLDGTVVGRAFGFSASPKTIRKAIALEAINIKNQNPEMSDIEAAREAARRLASGAASEGTTVAPAPKGPAGLGSATIKK